MATTSISSESQTQMSTSIAERPGPGATSVEQQEALARLMYVVEHRRQSATVVGPTGSGKSMLFACLADRIRRSQRHAVLLDCEIANSSQLTARLADQLHFWPEPEDGLDRIWICIENLLAGRQASGIETVFLIDHINRSSFGLEILRRLRSFNDRFSDSCLTTIVTARPDTRLPEVFSTRPVLRVELPLPAQNGMTS